MTDNKVRPHPYADLEGSALWMEVDRAIAELLQNRDLIEVTPHPYIVGYICKKLFEAGLIEGS